MPHRSPTSRNARGFTMVEVLIAMGIFAIAFAAVATVFPVAILVQKQAANSVRAREAIRNAEAIMASLSISEAQLTDDVTYNSALQDDSDAITAAFDTNGKVVRLTVNGGDSWLTNTPVAGGPAAQMPVALRTFPTSTNATADRQFLWVPLLRDTEITAGAPFDFIWYVFILRIDNKTYPVKTNPADHYANPADPVTLPGVRRIQVTPTASGFAFSTASFNDTNGNGLMEQIQVGDTILDAYGTSYTVLEAYADRIEVSDFVLPGPTGVFPDRIWYAPPSAEDEDSPTEAVILITTDIVN